MSKCISENQESFQVLEDFRSRGYGSVAFTDFKETPVSELIEQRASEISEIKETLLVTNSPLILRKGDQSFIGFGATAEENLFSEVLKKALVQRSFSGSVAAKYTDGNPKQRIFEGIAKGWSLKDGNRASEVIPCTGAGSCVEIVCDKPEVLAALEVYRIRSYAVGHHHIVFNNLLPI